MQSNLNNVKPTLYLCISLFLLQIVYGFGFAQENGNLATLEFWHTIAIYWALSWWFINDSQRPDAGWIQVYLDMGLFIYIAGFIMIPYYLFKSRGWKALYLIGMCVAIYIGAFLLGSMLPILLSVF